MYSIEFTTQGRSRCMSIRLWKGDSLVRVEHHRHNLLESTPGSYLGAIPSLLSFISSKPNLVSISGCTSMVFQALESSGLFDYGIQYPFRFDVFSLRKRMHPSVLESCYVFGPVDIFAQLTFLVAFLNGCTDQPWALQCPEIIKVCFCWFLSLGSLLLVHKSHRFPRYDGPKSYGNRVSFVVGSNQMQPGFQENPLFKLRTCQVLAVHQGVYD